MAGNGRYASGPTDPFTARYRQLPACSPAHRDLVCRGCSVRGAESKFPLPPGAVAQLGERLDRTQEVRGSSPLSSILLDAQTHRRTDAADAQGYKGTRLAIA